MQQVMERRGWGALALLVTLLALAAMPAGAQAANVAPECQLGINSQILRTGKPTKLQVFCSDPDGQALTIGHTTPEHGTLGSFAYNASSDAYEATYTPAGTYTGPDDFAFTVSDGQATSPSYGYDLVITENHAPRCEPTNAFHTKVDEPVLLNVFCADQDIQDQNLTYSTVTGQGPDHGSLGPVSDQTVEYTPSSRSTGSRSTAPSCRRARRRRCRGASAPGPTPSRCGPRTTTAIPRARAGT
jgi:Bacterial Ig domain